MSVSRNTLHLSRPSDHSPATWERFRRNVGRMTISQKSQLGEEKKTSRSPVSFPWSFFGRILVFQTFCSRFFLPVLKWTFHLLDIYRMESFTWTRKKLTTAQGRGVFFQGCSSSKRSFWGSKWVHITNEKGVYNYPLHNGLWHQSSVTFLLTCDLLPCSGRS